MTTDIIDSLIIPENNASEFTDAELRDLSISWSALLKSEIIDIPSARQKLDSLDPALQKRFFAYVKNTFDNGTMKEWSIPAEKISKTLK
jgi:hypothetical protein